MTFIALCGCSVVIIVCGAGLHELNRRVSGNLMRMKGDFPRNNYQRKQLPWLGLSNVACCQLPCVGIMKHGVIFFISFFYAGMCNHLIKTLKMTECDLIGTFNSRLTILKYRNVVGGGNW